MDEKTLRIFQRAVLQQCEFAFIAMNDLKFFLEQDDQNRIWYSIQSYLIAVANVSKYLWPPVGRKKSDGGRQLRASVLRASLHADQLVTLRNRTLRDHFEHFDERIDKWAETSKERYFADSIVHDDVTIKWLMEGDSFRILNRNTLELTFNGQLFSLTDFNTELENVRVHAIAEVFGLKYIASSLSE